MLMSNNFDDTMNSLTYIDISNSTIQALPSTSKTPQADETEFAENDNSRLFHEYVEELSFEGPSERYEFAQPAEDSDEEVDIKYPYERPDEFGSSIDRIRSKLHNGEFDLKQDADETLQQIKDELKAEKIRKSFESKYGDDFKAFSKGNIYTCVICSKAFNNSEELQKHTNSAHPMINKNFRCKQCGASFKYKKNLNLHIKKHQERPEFECQHCSVVYQTEPTLLAHINKYHAKNETSEPVAKEVQCSICSKMVCEYTLKSHLYYCKNKERISEQRKNKKQSLSVPCSPAVSTISSKSFTSAGNITSTPCSPTVSYIDKSCTVCGENFASRQSMLRHVGRKHPEKKDDPDVVGVRYISKESPLHQYSCTECGKRFTTRAALTLHKDRIHLNKKLYACEFCDKRYPIPAELRKHVKTVHKKGETIDELEF